MNSLPLVSVITVVYNAEDFIENAIKSVLEQTYKGAIEYIIVDGASQDNTIKIVNRYKNRISKIISEKDNGISDAFNKGINLATGDIIGILNADDWYERNTIEMVVANMDENTEIIYGNLRMWKKKAPEYVVTGDHKRLINEMTVNHPTVFVKRDCYLKYGTFNTKIHYAMDYDLMLRFFVNNVRFKYVPEILANMSWAGKSDKYWKQGCYDTLLIKNNIFPKKRLQNLLYYYKHLFAIGVSKMLQKLRLTKVLKFYRSRSSVIKKKYN